MNPSVVASTVAKKQSEIEGTQTSGKIIINAASEPIVPGATGELPK